MPPHPLINFEIRKYYQNQPRFNCVYSRDNLPKTKDGTYVINLDEYSDIKTHWMTLYVQNNNVTYFDSFEVEHILESKHLSVIKTEKQILLEYKHMIR